MFGPCKVVLTKAKLIGIILTSVAIGMLIILMFPCWGYFLAIILLILGISIIIKS